MAINNDKIAFPAHAPVNILSANSYTWNPSTTRHPGTLLDSRSLSNFVVGHYLVWTIQGHVTVKFTNQETGSNAISSGIFFGGGSSTSSSLAAGMPLASGAAGPLDSVRVHPNPWRSDHPNAAGIVFDQMTPNSVAKMFTIPIRRS